MRKICLAQASYTWIKPICNFFAFYGLSLDFLKENRSRIKLVICNSDVSPEIAALCIAANQAGIPVLCSQSSLLHKMPLPFTISAAILSNDRGWRIFENNKTENAVIFQRQETLPFVRGPVQNDVRDIGIALNNFFDSLKFLNIIATLRKRYPDAAINVRRHPNCRKNIEAFPVFDRHGTIESFAAMNDFVVCGNSNIQIDLLRFGCPVVHTSIEEMPFDVCRFVSEGAVFGAENIDSLDIAAINKFYGNSLWSKRIRKKFANGRVMQAWQNPEILGQWLSRNTS